MMFTVKTSDFVIDRSVRKRGHRLAVIGCIVLGIGAALLSFGVLS